jgi:hypothetical protein
LNVLQQCAIVLVIMAETLIRQTDVATKDLSQQDVDTVFIDMMQRLSPESRQLLGRYPHHLSPDSAESEKDRPDAKLQDTLATIANLTKSPDYYIDDTDALAVIIQEYKPAVGLDNKQANTPADKHDGGAQDNEEEHVTAEELLATLIRIRAEYLVVLSKQKALRDGANKPNVIKENQLILEEAQRLSDAIRRNMQAKIPEIDLQQHEDSCGLDQDQCLLCFLLRSDDSYETMLRELREKTLPPSHSHDVTSGYGLSEGGLTSPPVDDREAPYTAPTSNGYRATGMRGSDGERLEHPYTRYDRGFGELAIRQLSRY